MKPKAAPPKPKRPRAGPLGRSRRKPAPRPADAPPRKPRTIRGPDRPKRHPAVQSDDAAYALSLAYKMGKGASNVAIAKLVNRRRHRRVYDEEIAAGTPHVDAEAIATASELSIASISRDLQVAWRELKQEVKVSAAMTLHQQIQAVADELHATYRLDEQIAAELERSRKVKWERSTKSFSGPAPTKQKKSAPDRMHTNDTVYSAEVAARADLFGRLQKNFELRIKLRDEERRLLVAAEILGSQIPADAPPKDLLMMLRDPERRGEAAAALYAREVALTTDAPLVTVMAPELRTIALLQAEDRRRKLMALRDLYRFSPAEEGDGAGDVIFEMVFLESDGGGGLPEDPGGDVITVPARA